MGSARGVKLTSKAVQPNDHTSDIGVGGSSSPSRNSGACHLSGPTSGLERDRPAGRPRSSMT